MKRIAVAIFVVSAAVGAVVVGAGAAAVEGVSQSTGNAGSLGSTTFGVQGYAPGASTAVQGVSTSGIGLFGGSVSNVGVRAESTGTYANGAAAFSSYCSACPGSVNYSDSAIGVFGSTAGTLSNINAIGVWGRAPNGGIGVYGSAPFPGWAGYFYGDLRVTGIVSQGSATVQIDHPLDPSNKVLTHAMVESSEMKTVYDGVAVLDERGEATVELPDWFEGLNGDFRYQLTPIGEHAPLYVSHEVSENRFGIAGGYAHMKVSWQITGVRRDAYAKSRPIEVESVKPIEMRGRFLHPEAFGRTWADSFDAERTKGSARAVDAVSRTTRKR